MKQNTRSSKPALTGKKLDFFYSILTLWESNDPSKVVKDFRSTEIKRFLSQIDSKKRKVLFFTTDPKAKDRCSCKYSLYIVNSKDSQAMSLLYHLRNAFAHNDISVLTNRELIFIEHRWKNELRLKAFISFKVLKELIETIRGEHNVSDKEKKK